MFTIAAISSSAITLIFTQCLLLLFLGVCGILQPFLLIGRNTTCSVDAILTSDKKILPKETSQLLTTCCFLYSPIAVSILHTHQLRIKMMQLEAQWQLLWYLKHWSCVLTLHAASKSYKRRWRIELVFFFTLTTGSITQPQSSGGTICMQLQI